MKSYYIGFYKHNKIVCGKYQTADNRENAMLLAEFSLLCNYQNVEYDSVKILREEKEND